MSNSYLYDDEEELQREREQAKAVAEERDRLLAELEESKKAASKEDPPPQGEPVPEINIADAVLKQLRVVESKTDMLAKQFESDYGQPLPKEGRDMLKEVLAEIPVSLADVLNDISPDKAEYQEMVDTVIAKVHVRLRREGLIKDKVEVVKEYERPSGTTVVNEADTEGNRSAAAAYQAQFGRQPKTVGELELGKKLSKVGR